MRFLRIWDRGFDKYLHAVNNFPPVLDAQDGYVLGLLGQQQLVQHFQRAILVPDGLQGHGQLRQLALVVGWLTVGDWPVVRLLRIAASVRPVALRHTVWRVNGCRRCGLRPRQSVSRRGHTSRSAHNFAGFVNCFLFSHRSAGSDPRTPRQTHWLTGAVSTASRCHCCCCLRRRRRRRRCCCRCGVRARLSTDAIAGRRHR